ncbi:hypothetical protein O1D97_04470 [Marinomonas sp. 15G1-11]|uniref:PfkB family carbohydrate kinase n=1 Tax=Marinomonas phaeophyticola TaxID=3004091 RepID=A0ABT4JSX7_9GAMM|nr:hypothetical protein [Marinomonas sp. 15G1-11]MCZ2720918.1 hypothetical protein [Marinomonas sp. 15G1-11]
MAALSEGSPDVVEAAMTAAKNHGAIVSYDLNYRESLWKDRGGREAANDCNTRLIQKADVLFGIESLPRKVDTLDKEVFSEALHSMQARFPNVQLFVTTMRIVKDASHNDWGDCVYIMVRFSSHVTITTCRYLIVLVAVMPLLQA